MKFNFITPSFDDVPEELTSSAKWLVWRAEPNKDPKKKPLKVPYQTFNCKKKASTVEPSHWSTFQKACEAYSRGSFTGIGFVLDNSGIVGVDIDDCINERGDVDSRAVELVNDLDASYVETSPSGRGLRAFGYAEPLHAGVNGFLKNGLRVELYSSARYLTVTGNVWRNNGFSVLKNFAKFADEARQSKKERIDCDTGEVIFLDEKIGQNIFQNAVNLKGRKLKTGDGRRELILKFIQSRSAMGMNADDLLNCIIGLVAQFFDRDDPVDFNDIQNIIRSYREKDYKSEVDFLALLNEEEYAQEQPAEREAFCEELLRLPHALGAIQDYVFNRMIYPSRAVAAITAIATLNVAAMPNVRIESRLGALATNEQYVILSATGTGKEDTRKSIIALLKESEKHMKLIESEKYVKSREVPTIMDLNSARPASIMMSAPASQQGLHRALESNNSQLILADEFGEWLDSAKSDPHKQSTIGYLMQAYTSPFSSIAPPQSIAGNYSNVERPRIALFATSTCERMLEVVNSSHLNSGAYNRIVWFLSDAKRPDKRYEGHVTEISRYVLDAIAHVMALPEGTQVVFSDEAWSYYQEHDKNVVEPLTGDAKHAALAGRLSEQALRLSVLFALSDERTTVSAKDLQVAYKIRENLHNRIFDELNDSGGLNVSRDTVSSQALEQVRNLFKKNQIIQRAHLQSRSLLYRKLDLMQRQLVVKALEDEGAITMITKGKVWSNIFKP
jgi:hypothetical protein